MLTVPANPRVLVASACRLVLVEDDVLLRELLKDVLLRRCGLREVIDFGAGAPAADYCLREPPELLMTDLRLPDMDGREIVRRIRRQPLATRIIAITSYVDAVLPAELISLGVAGLVDKSCSLDHVDHALQSVLTGGLYFAASVSPMMPTTPAREVVDKSPALLSEQERTMARLIAQGLRSKEIATQMGLNTRTAERYRTQLLEKLQLTDTTSLIRWCVRHGLD